MLGDTNSLYEIRTERRVEYVTLLEEETGLAINRAIVSRCDRNRGFEGCVEAIGAK